MPVSLAADLERPRLGFVEKVWSINWGLLVLVTLIASIGFVTLYSAAGGSLQPWAGKQMIRFAIFTVMAIAVALVDIRVWRKLAYPIYGIVFVLLVVVELKGAAKMGAERWIDIGFIQIQPSELMKVSLVIVLARYFNGLTNEEVGKPWRLIVPALLVFAPAVLVLKQPDLGTAGKLIMCGGALFLLAGVRIWKFALVLALIAAVVPYAWNHLRDYQKNRVYTFLNPENDPLGTGYHIIQSKIALGSGGLFGKGYMQGSQAHLNFLPEKQTDFIFTMLAEEWGMVGGLFVLGLYTLVFIYGLAIALRVRNHFGRVLAMGVTINFFLYVFINTAMVMGLIPVVGVPLPLVSYGGTAMLTVLFGWGLVMSAWIHRDVRIGLRGESMDE
jgi:rod shape determining protein RodA